MKTTHDVLWSSWRWYHTIGPNYLWDRMGIFKPKRFQEICKVRLFLDRSCAILSSFKIVVVFNILSAEIKTKSSDVLLKMTTFLKELRIVQLWSKNKQALEAPLQEGSELRNNQANFIKAHSLLCKFLPVPSISKEILKMSYWNFEHFSSLEYLIMISDLTKKNIPRNSH